jgi:hypothetical protein
MSQDELLALVEDKAKRVLARPGLRVEQVVREDGFACVAVSGEAHVVEQRLDLSPLLGLTGDAAGAAVERAVTGLRPEFARTFPALRTEG